jgi:hypothetical protein
VNVRLYMDVHVRRVVTDGLRLRKVDVLTTQDDEAAELDDPELVKMRVRPPHRNLDDLVQLRQPDLRPHPNSTARLAARSV